MTASTDFVKLVHCSVGSAAFCLNIESVRGVERSERLLRTPHEDAPGMIRVRGVEWPVYAPSRWFGPTLSSAGKQVVLIEAEQDRFGIVIDRVACLDRVAANRVTPPPRIGAASAWVVGVLQTESGPIAVVDVNRLNAPVPRQETIAATRTVRPVVADRWLAIGWREHPLPGGRPVAIAVPMAIVVEVIDSTAIAPIPGAADYYRGMIEWRGRTLVVLDPAEWVGLGLGRTSERVVIVRAGGKKIGLDAGRHMKVLPAGAAGIPSRFKFTYTPNTIHGAFDTTDTTIVLPDWDKLLQSVER